MKQNFNIKSRFLYTLIGLILSSCSQYGPLDILPDEKEGSFQIQTEGVNVHPLTHEDAALEENFAQQEIKNLTLQFKEERYSPEEEATILKKYDHLDPQNLIRTDLLKKLILNYHANLNLLKNKSYITALDFRKRSNEKRLYVVNVKTGSVEAFHTAHGRGSDQEHDGYAEKFSNVSGSNASSLGFYLVNETYQGKHGLSLRLDGLSSTNSNARDRAIVIHGADYVQDQNVIQGRSFGCPAIPQKYVNRVMPLIKGQSLMLALH